MDGFCEKMQYSFLDYISSGFELNFMVAVDFTGIYVLNYNDKLYLDLFYYFLYEENFRYSCFKI